MAEQGGAEAGGFERPAELQDKSEDVKLHGPGRGSAADECLGAEGSEANGGRVGINWQSISSAR